jgi:hypothetical protein
MRLNIPQILFMSFFVATIMTISDSVIKWEHRIYVGIFAGITTMVGSSLAKFIFKDRHQSKGET